MAQRLHLLNTAMLVDAVTRETVRAVVLTEHDWGVFDTMPSGRGPFRNAFDAHCRLAFTVPSFGEFQRMIEIYVPRW